MNVVQVVFSTNRPEYLTRALASQRHLIWPEGYNVHKILFDDFPHKRDDDQIRDIARTYGYTEVHLHTHNKSLGATWRECWDLLAERNYDWIWQQEDDVEILRPVKMNTLMTYLGISPHVSQLRLARQAWYPGEPEPQPDPQDEIIGPYRIDRTPSVYFSPMASLYDIWATRIDFPNWYYNHYPDEPVLALTNPNEGLVGKMLLEGFGMRARVVKDASGGPMVNHIGAYTQGRILLPHEPTAKRWLYRNPEQRYCSKTGQPYA